jgi:hypothetical protein
LPAAPRKETAGIAAIPDKSMKATVRLTGAAPLSSAPVPVANPPSTGTVESVPMPVCWILLGVAALTFLIQLWTYFS